MSITAAAAATDDDTNNAEAEVEVEAANGFLVLNHCDVYLARGEKNKDDDDNDDDDDDCPKDVLPPTVKVDSWFNVEIPPSQDLAENHLRRQTQTQTQTQTHRGVVVSRNVDDANANINANANANINANANANTNININVNINVDHHCRHCCLVLAKNLSFREKTTQLLRITDDDSSEEGSDATGPRYDGTIRGTKCHCGSGKQRSDAALMMGLALQSQDLGHIVIRSIRVGLYNNNNNSSSSSSSSSSNSNNNNNTTPATQCTPEIPKPHNNNHNNNGYRKEKACLLISFWCREIIIGIGIDIDVNANLPNQQQQPRRFFERSTKQLLHPATQLIMSIMSSDWKEYDAKIAELSFLSSLSVVEEHGSRKRKTNTHDDIDTIHENDNNNNNCSRSSNNNNNNDCSSRSSNNNNNNNNTNRIQTIHHHQRIPSISFFPSKMNLEDIFQRTNGVSPTLLLSDPEFHYSERRRNNNNKDSSRMETVNSKSHNYGNGNERIDSEHPLNDETINNGNNAAAATTTTTTTATSTSTSTATATKLTTLPGDVLCHNIGQYLRAKSLDSLRCTCKHLHWTLRAVVPGLKLRLYSHQIKSLMWMRGRESTLITEDDLLQQGQRQNRHHSRPRQRTSTSTSQTQNMTHWIKNTTHGDAHRAATGGGTVVLCPRRRRRRQGRGGIRDNDDANGYPDPDEDADEDLDPDKNSAQVRISQFDHSEVMERRKYGNVSAVGGGGGDNPLARKVARGGLLCDDPGLGTYCIPREDV
jgi:hypothetical protein